MVPLELPTDASSYTFLGKIGQGAFASVWKAQTIVSSSSSLSSSLSSSSKAAGPLQEQQHPPPPENKECNSPSVVVAIKVLNLDHVDSDLQEIRMEVQLMRLSLHPNILFCYTAFLEQTQLWVVTPFMNKGSSVSCLQQARQSLINNRNRILVADHPPTGSTQPDHHPWLANHLQQQQQSLVSMEPHILYILQQTLLGLQYIHDNGQIHRDIKGSNILLNGAGQVKIADFGVSGWLIPQNEKAKTFVGTPCWMAPEVMEQIDGYDYKADLWSLGITALELAKGYPPYAKYAPMKVLILTIQEAPPSLDTYEYEDEALHDDDDDGHVDYPQEWSAQFKQLVSWLLQKNPSQRPTCQELLQSPLLAKAGSQNGLESEICTLVPDVGITSTPPKQQEQSQPLNQPQHKQHEQQQQLQDMAHDNDRGKLEPVWLEEVSSSGHDRAPGTTWVFAAEDGSTALSSSTYDNNSTYAAKGLETADDVLTELDEFCGATGGENYKKEESELTNPTPIDQNNTNPSIAVDNQMKESVIQMKGGQGDDAEANDDDDDLEDFLDEFEKTTAGENFHRPT